MSSEAEKGPSLPESVYNGSQWEPTGKSDVGDFRAQQGPCRAESGYTRPPETGVLSLLLPHIPAFPGAHELSVSRHSSVGKDRLCSLWCQLG